MNRAVTTLALLIVSSGLFAADDDTRVVHTARFDLHSDPWINLHHFLYQWSRAEAGIGTGRQKVAVPERFSVGKLSADERDAWRQTLSFYRDAVASLGHFDQSMLAQKISLLELRGDLTATPEDHIEGIAAAMQSAMPVYLEHWWPRHDADNRQWANAIRADLAKSEPEFVALTERVYHANWPQDLQRVDVSAYANFRAGYTATGHIVIFASDPGNQGSYGLETILHEVQHTRGIRRPAIARLEAAIDGPEPPLPDNLWHSMIFATAGAFVKAYAASQGAALHLPYWEREQFGGFGAWQDAYTLVNAHWLPVIEGEATTEEAIRGIARDFSRTGEANE